MIRDLVMEIREELAELDKRIAAFDRRIRTLFRKNEACQRIGCIEGIGPLSADLASRQRRAFDRTPEACLRHDARSPAGQRITASALVAAAGDQGSFRNGREFAASCRRHAFGVTLGLVPRPGSSGGKARLFGRAQRPRPLRGRQSASPKRGDRDLRRLMILAARAVPGKARGKTDPRSQWIARLRERQHAAVVAVALASKDARIVWPVLARAEEYDPARVAAVA
ncbi:IS110 family transposase [Poseidonocella sp. HB161398]|uniref:IS110 family transposase n=1 Tax=Poseidonocella sp. HB161398 TaxID=2320855 RepID=UPI001109496C|nr:IS110 family transposase [Poseidonocella sp. HB161398]